MPGSGAAGVPEGFAEAGAAGGGLPPCPREVGTGGGSMPPSEGAAGDQQPEHKKKNILHCEGGQTPEQASWKG